NIEQGQSVLEIGCGSGAFVKLVRDSGRRAMGIELNREAVQKAKSDGLPVDSLSLEEAADKYRKTFDCVCCFQVLEHVPEPASFLSHSIDMLKVGGTFITVVPNRDGFLKYHYEPLDLPPHHMSQ